jgi:hypothetical protein
MSKSWQSYWRHIPCHRTPAGIGGDKISLLGNVEMPGREEIDASGQLLPDQFLKRFSRCTHTQDSFVAVIFANQL